ncbi:MAG: hypothetical protein ACPGRC_07450 [Salibacteraceae bacterium]
MSEDKKSSAAIGGVIFVGCMFVGGGIGLFFGRPDVGGSIGMGIGFISMGLVWAAFKTRE